MNSVELNIIKSLHTPALMSVGDCARMLLLQAGKRWAEGREERRWERG